VDSRTSSNEQLSTVKNKVNSFNLKNNLNASKSIQIVTTKNQKLRVQPDKHLINKQIAIIKGQNKNFKLNNFKGSSYISLINKQIPVIKRQSKNFKLSNLITKPQISIIKEQNKNFKLSNLITKSQVSTIKWKKKI